MAAPQRFTQWRFLDHGFWPINDMVRIRPGESKNSRKRTSEAFAGEKGNSRQKPVTTASRTLDRPVSDVPVNPICHYMMGECNNRPLRLSSFI